MNCTSLSARMCPKYILTSCTIDKNSSGRVRSDQVKVWSVQVLVLSFLVWSGLFWPGLDFLGSQGAFEEVLGDLRGLLTRLGAVFGVFWALLGPLGAVLGTSWDLLWEFLGASWTTKRPRCSQDGQTSSHKAPKGTPKGGQRTCVWMSFCLLGGPGGPRVPQSRQNGFKGCPNKPPGPQKVPRVTPKVPKSFQKVDR